jgi:hypothetical protein
MNGIGAAGLRRAIRAVCAVYSGPDTFGGVLHPVVRSRSLEFGIPGRKTDARFAVLLETGAVGTVGNGQTLICLVVTYPLSCE